LPERRNSLIAVDDQITIRLLGSYHDDRRLLTAGRQRRQQPPLPLWPAHTKVLQAPLKLVQFQPHAPRSLDSSTLHPAASGIARQRRVVSPDLLWNQYDVASTGIARGATEVRP
jgi:hypothetical protein